MPASGGLCVRTNLDSIHYLGNQATRVRSDRSQGQAPRTRGRKRGSRPTSTPLLIWAQPDADADAVTSLFFPWMRHSALGTTRADEVLRRVADPDVDVCESGLAVTPGKMKIE